MVAASNTYYFVMLGSVLSHQTVCMVAFEIFQRHVKAQNKIQYLDSAQIQQTHKCAESSG